MQQMALDTLGAHFEHISEYAHLASAALCHRVDGAFDGIGICVVAIVNDCDITSVDHVCAASYGLVSRYSAYDLIIGQSEFNADRRTLKSSIDHMASVGRDADVHASLAGYDIAGLHGGAYGFYILCPYIGIFAEAVQDFVLPAGAGT